MFLKEKNPAIKVVLADPQVIGSFSPHLFYYMDSNAIAYRRFYNHSH